MKKIKMTKLPLAMLLGAVIGLSSCNKEDEQKIAQQTETIQSIRTELKQRDSTYNQLIGMLNNAEEQVAEIIRRENLALNTSNEKLKSGNLVLELKKIDELVKESNTTIQNLRAQLRKSNVNVNALENRVDKLSTVLEQQRNTIATLKAEVDSKKKELQAVNVKYDSVQIQARNQQKSLKERDEQIEMLNATNNNFNKVHYAVGSYKELKEKGLVDKEGGFLWIGRTIDLKANTESDKFTETDIRNFSELKIESDKFELVTEHPASSYTIVEDELDKNIKYLKVLDAKEFWEISNYLVVSTK